MQGVCAALPHGGLVRITTLQTTRVALQIWHPAGPAPPTPLIASLVLDQRLISHAC